MGKLGRICRRCDKRYVPVGKSDTLCKDCWWFIRKNQNKNPKRLKPKDLNSSILQYIIMEFDEEKTTITVRKNTQKDLMLFKIKTNARSLDDVINLVIKKLKEEYKGDNLSNDY